MTRNLYLGADLAPAIAATTPAGSCSSPPPARSCAKSSPTTSRPGPRAWRRRSSPRSPTWSACRRWRSGAPARQPGPGPQRRTDRDHGPLRLPAAAARPAQQGRDAVRSGRRQNEFDLEAPGDENGIPGDGPAAGHSQRGDAIGRLTMRDVILARHGAGVQTWNPQSRQFQNPAGGADSRPTADDQTRLDGRPTRRCAAAGRSASSTPTWRRSTRRAGAEHPCSRPASWSRRAGRRRAACRSSSSATSTPTTTRSNRATSTPTGPCSRAGLVERSTGAPARLLPQIEPAAEGCRRQRRRLRPPGRPRDDQRPERDNACRDSAVTGLLPVNGFWDSDHAGLFSALRFDR